MKTPPAMDNQQKFILACHEAGHAVLSHVLNERPVKHIHLFGDQGGYCDLGKLPDTGGDVRDRVESLLIVSLAGQASANHAKFIPWTITGAPQPAAKPIPQAINHIRQKSFNLLYHDAHGPQQCTDAAYQDRLAKRLFPDSHGPYLYWMARRTDALVINHWRAIQAVAVALFHRSYLKRREFLQIINMEVKKCAL